MSQRHKAYKETLDRGLASEWNDDHLESFAVRICHVGLFLGPSLGAEWDFTETLGGSNPTWALVAGHAFVVLNTGGVTGQISAMKHELSGAASNITSYDDLPILTTAVDLDTFHNLGKVVEFGFFDEAVNIFTANQDGAYFRVFDNELYAVTGDGAAETTTNLGAYSQYSHYRIEFLSASIRFFVDDMVNSVATHVANLPDSDLTIKFGVVSGNNVDSTIRVDACALSRLRQQ